MGFFPLPLLSPFPSLVVVKCSNPLHINAIESSNLINNGGGLKNLVISAIVDDQVDESANRNESDVLLNGLDKSTQIDELTEIQNQETKVSEIAELSEARPMVEEAEDGERKAMNKNKEKLESVKAASISAIVGTLASLPISLTHDTNAFQLTVSTAITIITCALYGATFRYAVRRDMDDFHLKTGTSAAFGIVKGVATLDGRPYLEHEAGSLLPQALNGAICVSENVLIFLFAAAGLDICYKMGILSPFPVERSVSRTKM
ncbi:hypothetical protein Ccrd_002651 [Cynara cardunculus var. scolymus]|uniref:Uncharacterized protein n=1 Tax=Cynara cardunculus var. scolymus TaxID=59895 RepID=A0A103XR00_CYNCS|nr:hypothetical protein Ccrd_002651 [Cynara cardunculus var. scolymus]